MQVDNLQVMDLLVSGKWLTGFILPAWLNADGSEKAQKRKQHGMQLLADGVITPLSGAHPM